MDLNDKLIKAIYVSDMKENIVLEGSYAVYKVWMQNINNNTVNDRRLNITDLDIDVYDKIDEKYNSQNGNTYELNKWIRWYLNELFSDVFDKLLKQGVNGYITIKDLSKLERRENNKTVSYGIEVRFILEGTNGEFAQIDTDINFTKEHLLKFSKYVLLNSINLDVLVYEPEKYLANKLMAFIKHQYYFNIKGRSKYDGNYAKMVSDYKDINNIITFLENDKTKIEMYLNLMGAKLKYCDFVNIIENERKIYGWK